MNDNETHIEQKKKGKGCLIACFFSIGLFLVCATLIVLIFLFKGNDIKNRLLDKLTNTVGVLLTSDHTPQEKEEFQKAFADFMLELKAADLKKGVQTNSKLIFDLQDILQDEKITREESAQWIKEYREGGR
jgi:hypothetical protein